MSGLPSWLNQLRESEITACIKRDPRTHWNDVLLGETWDAVRSEVVGGGQADFDQPLRGLSPDDRALLYAYALQPGHLRELIVAFGALFDAELPPTPTLLDVGCGPWTAGLAFAAVAGPTCAFRYYGVDHARSMLRLARRLAAGARALRALHPHTSLEWHRSCEGISTGPPRQDTVVIALSYLLESPTLDAPKLADQIARFCAAHGPGPAVLLHTNTVRSTANQAWPQLRERLRAHGFTARHDDSGRIEGPRGAPQTRPLSCAVLFRPPSRTLRLR